MGSEGVEFRNVFPRIIVREVIARRDFWFALACERTQSDALPIALDHHCFTGRCKLKHMFELGTSLVKGDGLHTLIS